MPTALKELLRSKATEKYTKEAEEHKWLRALIYQQTMPRQTTASHSQTNPEEMEKYT